LEGEFVREARVESGTEVWEVKGLAAMRNSAVIERGE